MCILTTIEYKLGDTSLDNDSLWPSVRQNISKFMNTENISDNQIKILCYTVWTTSWAITLARISNIL